MGVVGKGRKRGGASSSLPKEALKQEWSRLISIFDGIEEAFYVADMETYEILFINRSLRLRLGRAVVGGVCYRELQGLNSPCPFCTNDIIRKIKPATHRWEHFNPVLNRTYSLHDRVITWPDGRDVRLEMAVDVTEYKRIENESQEKGRVLATLMSNLPGMAYRCLNEPGWTMEFISEGCRALTGLAPGALMGAHGIPFSDLIHPEDRSMVWDTVQSALKVDRPFRITYRIIDASGVEKWVWEQGRGIRGPSGEVLFLEGFIADVTDRKRAEEALARREVLLDTAGRMARFGGWSANLLDGRVVWSDQVADIHEVPRGFSPSVEKGIAFYAPEWRDKIVQKFEACARDGISYDEEMEIISARGRRIWIRTFGEAVRDKAGAIIRVEGAFHDISDRKRAEEQIRTALAEKETLLRELYHRTKNNMEVIRAMLRIQEAFGREAGIDAFIKDIDRKIMAMAMAHKKLTQSHDLARIRLDEYLTELSALLVQGHAAGSRRIGLDLDLRPVTVSLDTAIPCGLIVNELFCNAVKYAFAEERSGEIRMRLDQDSDGWIELDFADDGPGFPEGTDYRGRAGLGMKIIFDIVENQLLGTIRVVGRSGTAFEIRFRGDSPCSRITA